MTFTRGFVSSQAFVERFGDGVPTLLPGNAADGLAFKPTHQKAVEALTWMGFEARSAILEVLDQAIADKQSAGARWSPTTSTSRTSSRGWRSSEPGCR